LIGAKAPKLPRANVTRGACGQDNPHPVSADARKSTQILISNAFAGHDHTGSSKILALPFVLQVQSQRGNNYAPARPAFADLQEWHPVLHMREIRDQALRLCLVYASRARQWRKHRTTTFVGHGSINSKHSPERNSLTFGTASGPCSNSS